jgi:hypothetical protein
VVVVVAVAEEDRMGAMMGCRLKAAIGAGGEAAPRVEGDGGGEEEVGDDKDDDDVVGPGNPS